MRAFSRKKPVQLLTKAGTGKSDVLAESDSEKLGGVLGLQNVLLAALSVILKTELRKNVETCK